MNPTQLSPLYAALAVNVDENFVRHLERKRGHALNLLSLSGGGQNGAFGAGFLIGWRESGRRPEFDVVGGVSTGALLATHALLGTPADDATLEQRAKAYLDANCAHCHNPAGAADTSALHLNIDAPVGRLYGVCKTPVAVGRGSGDHRYDIFPGRPDESIVIFRMRHTDPAIAMPELGRSVVHTEGVALIAEWIGSMNGEC